MSQPTIASKKYLKNLVKEEISQMQQDIGLGLASGGGSFTQNASILANVSKDFLKSVEEKEIRYFLNAEQPLEPDIKFDTDLTSRIVYVPSKKTQNLSESLKKLKIDKKSPALHDNIKALRMGIAFFIKWYGDVEGLKEIGPGLKPNQEDYAKYFLQKIIKTNKETNMNNEIIQILNLDESTLKKVENKSRNFEGFYIDATAEVSKHKAVVEMYLKNKVQKDKNWNSTADAVSVALSISTSFIPQIKALSFGKSIIMDTLIFLTAQTALGGSLSLKKITQNSETLLEQLKNKIEDIKLSSSTVENAEDEIFAILDRLKRLVNQFIFDLTKQDKKQAIRLRSVLKDVQNTSQTYREEISGEKTKEKLIKFANNKFQDLSKFFKEVGKVEQVIETSLSYSLKQYLNDFAKFIADTSPPGGLQGMLKEESKFGEDVEIARIKRGMINLIGKGKDIDRLEEYIEVFNQALQNPNQITPRNDVIASLKKSRGAGFLKFGRKAEPNAGALWQSGENLRSRMYDRASAMRKKGKKVMLSPQIDEFMMNGWVGLTRVDLSALGGGRKVYSIGFLNYDDDKSVPISFITSTRAGAQSAGLAAAIKDGTIGIKRSTGEVIYPEHVGDVSNYFLSLIKTSSRAEKLIEIIEEKNIDALKKYIVFLENYITFLNSVASFLQTYSGITSEDGLSRLEAKIILDNIANIAYWFSRWSRYE